MTHKNIGKATFFAPPERASKEEVRHQHEVVENKPLLKAALNAMPQGVIILNPQRQIIFANAALCKDLHVHSVREVLGQRPGEVFNCVHVPQSPSGCGTSETCQTCGAVIAILEAQKSGENMQECRLTRLAGQQEESVDLRVKAVNMEIDDQNFQVLTLSDVSDEKRRRMLERLFFHDILNTAGGLRGYAEMLKSMVSGELASLADGVYEISDALTQEILNQRNILSAENNELVTDFLPMETRTFLNEVIVRYQGHQEAEGKQLIMGPDVPDANFVSDPILLGRVVGNLVKNALEASGPGETVTVGAAASVKEIEFLVHNPAVMPREVQLQIFKRSFSTKGTGRGLGTYSVKMLTKNYLGGRVIFVSGPETGTIFRVIIPREPSWKGAE